MIFQIKEINGKHLLKHIVQEVVIFALCKTRMNPYFRFAKANKTHDIASIEFTITHLKDILFANLIPILIVILRKDQ